MAKFGFVPTALKSLTNFTGKASRIHVARVASSRPAYLLPGCYSSCIGGPVQAIDTSQQVTVEDSNRTLHLLHSPASTSPKARFSECRMRSQLQPCRRSSSMNWLTPISQKVFTQCYSSSPIAGPVHTMDASEKETMTDSNDTVHALHFSARDDLGCYSSDGGAPVQAIDTSQKVAVEDSNHTSHLLHSSARDDIGTSLRARFSECRMRSQLQLCARSSSLKWLTPISQLVFTRCYSSQGCPLAPSDPSDKSDSNQNDFNWHAHMASGNFLYKGKLMLGISTSRLDEYSTKNPMIDMRPVYGAPDGKLKPFVKDDAKGHTWQLINSLSEFHRIGLCVVDLDHSKVMICDGVAKFAADISFEPATDALIEENFIKLEMIIRGTLFQGKPLPYEMHHLLKIMRTEPVQSIALMKCHVALVRQAHKTAFFMRMYDLVNPLRFADYLTWLTILDCVPYEFVWLKKMLRNRLLKASLMRKRSGVSNPAVVLAILLKKLQKKIPDQAMFVYIYRCLSTHKMDDSVDPVTGEILYTEQMFEDILDTVLPRFKADLQYGLHKMGRLELAQLHTFFNMTVSAGTCNKLKELILLNHTDEAAGP